MALMTADQQTKVTIVGSAFVAGFAEAASYRFNQSLGTIVTFGGAVGGLFLALSQRGLLSDIGLGVASSSAGSIGHFAIQKLWPAAITTRVVGGAVQRPALTAGRRVGGLQNTETFRNVQNVNELKV